MQRFLLCSFERCVIHFFSISHSSPFFSLTCFLFSFYFPCPSPASSISSLLSLSLSLWLTLSVAALSDLHALHRRYLHNAGAVFEDETGKEVQGKEENGRRRRRKENYTPGSENHFPFASLFFERNIASRGHQLKTEHGKKKYSLYI